MGRSSQRKGADGERELAGILRGRGYDIERGGSLSYGEVPDSGKDDVYFTTLRDALPSELDEKDREILIAYYEEEIGYEELAKRLDIPVERCRVRVFRAKNRYRKLIEGKKISRRRKQKPPLRQLWI